MFRNSRKLFSTATAAILFLATLSQTLRSNISPVFVEAKPVSKAKAVKVKAFPSMSMCMSANHKDEELPLPVNPNPNPPTDPTAPTGAELVNNLGKKLPQVLPGVDLPSSVDVPVAISYPFTQERGQNFISGSALGTVQMMLGQPKSNRGSTVFAQNMYIETQKVARQIPNPTSYMFFGNGNHSMNLKHLLKTNPFFATALTEYGDGFELMSFSASDPKAEDPSASLFRQIVSCLKSPEHRVNIRFDANMDILEVGVFEVRCLYLYLTRLSILCTSYKHSNFASNTHHRKQQESMS